MFSFELPKWAVVTVPMAGGGSVQAVHVGGGRLLSMLPPLSAVGLRPGSDAGAVDPAAVAWDSATLPVNGEAAEVLLPFDAKSAADAVQSAADLGDISAISMVARMKSAESELPAGTA